MDKLNKICEGKSKIIYIDGKDIFMEFKGDVRCTAQKVQYDPRIAKLRLLFTYHLYEYLSKEIEGILKPTVINENTLKMEKVTPLPLEWIPRFVAAGSVVKRFGFEEGYEFSKMILKIDYKTDVDDFLITDDLIIERGLLTENELLYAKTLCQKIAYCIRELFALHDLCLWDFKMELGRTDEGKIVLIDEISLDGMRLKDKKTGRDLDKDVYRKTGNVELLINAYEEGYGRIFGKKSIFNSKLDQKL